MLRLPNFQNRLVKQNKKSKELEKHSRKILMRFYGKLNSRLRSRRKSQLMAQKMSRWKKEVSTQLRQRQNFL